MRSKVKKSEDSAFVSQLFGHELSRQEMRKMQIVEAAVDLFGKKGFDEVTFESIAVHCKVSRPLISHYFKNKLEVFMFAARYVRIRYQQQVLLEISKFTEPKAIFRAYVRAALRWYLEEPLHGRIWILYFYLCGSEKKVKTEHTELVNVGTKRIIELLQLIFKQANPSKEELLQKARLVQKIITGSLISEASEDLSPTNLTKERHHAYLACCEVVGLNPSDESSS